MKLRFSSSGGLPFLFLATGFFIHLSGCASTARTQICPVHVSFVHVPKDKIDFTDNEKLLLCGDPTKDSWKDIPPAQVEFTLRNFLKQRAYYTPTFSYANDTLSVDPGPLRRVTKLDYVGTPPHFDEIKMRDVVGQPLTSALLDKIQEFALSRLKNLSYACATLKIRASETDGGITVTLVPGPPFYFLEPELTDTIGLYPKAMRRFDAFELNAPFRYDWVKLSSNRAENDGIVVSSQFTFTCPKKIETVADPQGVSLHQLVLGGDRHLLTIGAGASTEEYPIAELTLKSVRLNDNGANLLVAFHASQRIQSANAILTDYLFKNAPRFDIAPNFLYSHDREVTFNSTTLQISTPLEYHGDLETKSWLVSMGPAVSRVFSVDDTGDKSLSYFSILGRINFTSHDYELYLMDPRSGWMSDFNVQMLSDSFSLHPLAMIYRLTGSRLFELNPVDPPQWLIGFRYGLATTASQDRPQNSSKVPPEDFNTLGGDQNLRGFGRDELNQGTVGAMTAVYFGTELRYAKSLALGIEPFLFFDGGALGSTPFELDSVFYYSPGFGIRWSTPFGAIRSTLAHGYLSKQFAGSDSLSHLQLFLSFGKEF